MLGTATRRPFSSASRPGPGKPWSGAEQRLAVAAAEQENEGLRGGAQLREAVGGVADEVLEGGAEAGGVAAQPLAEELQDLRELSRVGDVKLYFGHGFTAFWGWVA